MESYENSRNDEHNEYVEAQDACPSCGEDRMDYLVWNDAGTIVTCAICGAEYDPTED